MGEKIHLAPKVMLLEKIRKYEKKAWLNVQDVPRRVSQASPEGIRSCLGEIWNAAFSRS